MKEFNEFVEKKKILKTLVDDLSIDDGIMLEIMFYDFVKHYNKFNNIGLADVIHSVCECGSNNTHIPKNLRVCDDCNLLFRPKQADV